MSRRKNKKIIDDDDESWIASDESSEYLQEKDMESKIEKILKKTDLSFSNLYQEPLLEEDKHKLIEMFNVYLYMDDNTLEKYNMKLDIKKWFQEYKNRYAEFKKLKKKKISEL